MPGLFTNYTHSEMYVMKCNAMQYRAVYTLEMGCMNRHEYAQFNIKLYFISVFTTTSTLTEQTNNDSWPYFIVLQMRSHEKIFGRIAGPKWRLLDRKIYFA